MVSLRAYSMVCYTASSAERSLKRGPAQKGCNVSLLLAVIPVGSGAFSPLLGIKNPSAKSLAISRAEAAR